MHELLYNICVFFFGLRGLLLLLLFCAKYIERDNCFSTLQIVASTERAGCFLGAQRKGVMVQCSPGSWGFPRS
jgi:hypothetical protein